MTLDYPVPFHTPNLVWDSTIAIYLFLLGISSGAVQLAIAYKRSHKLENPSKNWIIRAAAVLGSVPTLIGLTLLIFHLARPWTFWKLMFNYQFNSVMSMGGNVIPSLYAVLGMLVCGYLQRRYHGAHPTFYAKTWLCR